MRGSRQMEQVIDNKFKGLVSNDSFRQYLGLSSSAQQRLRQQFEDIFMSGVEMMSYPASYSLQEDSQASPSGLAPSASKQG
jgi:hypothetical protein